MWWLKLLILDNSERAQPEKQSRLEPVPQHMDNTSVLARLLLL